MKIYTMREEWIAKRNADTERPNNAALTFYASEEKAMEQWEQRKQWRNERQGFEVRPAVNKKDITEKGYIVRYYLYNYVMAEVIIKTTIREHDI